MRIGKFFTLATIFVAAFMLGSCSKDDEEENDVNIVEHEYVDLGLPSGTLWATCNVGASKPEEYGDYFAWGETSPKGKYDWSTYKWCDGLELTLNKYCTNSTYGLEDGKKELEPEDDAATVNWGSDWCMPSFDQMEELYNYENITAEVTTQNGVLGILITSLKNGNTLFLPATRKRIDVDLEDVDYLGNYWTRSLIPEDHLIPEVKFLRTYPTAYYYYKDQSDGRTMLVYGTQSRIYGLAVRPVRAKK